MRRIIPNRSFRRTKSTRRKPSTLGSIFALQLAFIVAIVQMKLMASIGSTCENCSGTVSECSYCAGGRNPGSCSHCGGKGTTCPGGCSSHTARRSMF